MKIKYNSNTLFVYPITTQIKSGSK